MTQYWLAPRPKTVEHQHPFLVFDCHDRLHMPLTTFAKEAYTRVGPKTVQTYLYSIMPYFSWLDTDLWQQRAGVSWSAAPLQVRQAIDEYLVQHETGVWVMPAPKDPSEADRISPPDVTRVVEAMRNRFDYVIVDTPAALTEVVLAAFDLSDLLFCMATLDLPSVRNMGVFLNTLEKLKIPTENIRLILNKAETDVGIDVEQITKLFPQGFSSVLPYAKEVSRSINLGMPVITSSPGSEVSRRLAEGMMELLPEAERQHAQEAVSASGGRLGRLFKRFEATAH